jgi:hypothetical protein
MDFPYIMHLQHNLNHFLQMIGASSSNRNADMFSECEHNCLLKLAQDCKRRGLTLIEAQRQIEKDFGGFTTSFRIAQAVRRVFAPAPNTCVH